MKNVIAGLEEGLNAIAEALEGGSGQQVPAPVAADNGKVLKATGAGQVAWQEDATGAGVPTVTSGDDGKVLTADYTGGVGTYSWEDAPSGGGLPASTYEDEGKSLLVDQNGSPTWGYPHNLLPDSTQASSGDVLAINNQGNPAWTTPSGGGSLPSYDDSDVSKVLTVQYDDLDDRTYLEWTRPSSPVREVRYFSMLSKSDFTVDGSYVYKLFSEGDEPTANYEYTMIGFGTTGVPFSFCVTSCSVGQYYNENNGDLRIYFNKADFDMIDSSADITIRRIRYQ